MVLPEALLSTWESRKQQIYPAEVTAVPVALAVLQHELRGRDIINFVDNEAAMASLPCR